MMPDSFPSPELERSSSCDTGMVHEAAGESLGSGSSQVAADGLQFQGSDTSQGQQIATAVSRRRASHRAVPTPELLLCVCLV